MLGKRGATIMAHPNDNRAPIRLSASLMARVATIAERDGLSVTEATRRLLERTLDTREWLLEVIAETAVHNDYDEDTEGGLAAYRDVASHLGLDTLTVEEAIATEGLKQASGATRLEQSLPRAIS